MKLISPKRLQKYKISAGTVDKNELSAVVSAGCTVVDRPVEWCLSPDMVPFVAGTYWSKQLGFPVSAGCSSNEFLSKTSLCATEIAGSCFPDRTTRDTGYRENWKFQLLDSSTADYKFAGSYYWSYTCQSTRRWQVG